MTLLFCMLMVGHIPPSFSFSCPLSLLLWEIAWFLLLIHKRKREKREHFAHFLLRLLVCLLACKSSAPSSIFYHPLSFLSYLSSWSFSTYKHKPLFICLLICVTFLFFHLSLFKLRRCNRQHQRKKKEDVDTNRKPLFKTQLLHNSHMSEWSDEGQAVKTAKGGKEWRKGRKQTDCGKK